MTVVIGANGMHREALDFVDLISKPDFCSKQSIRIRAFFLDLLIRNLDQENFG
jgi:hypothetical protein